LTALRQLVLASANPKKVAELTELLAAHFEVLPRPDDAPETIEDRDTLEGNALKKASEIAEFVGAAAISDDTGLFVDALDGEPGVYSARYAGPDGDAEANVAKLLDALEKAAHAGRSDRSARFETVVAIVWPDGTELVARGQVEGHISFAPTGEGGFGYDPVFVPNEGNGRSFAEMTNIEKSEISHRARALMALRTKLGETPT